MSKNEILALIIIIGLTVTVLFIAHFFPKLETEPEPTPTPLNDYDAQITNVTFHLNGSSITVYIENKGKKLFKFNNIDVKGYTSWGLGQPESYNIDICTLYSLEKFNITLRHFWQPESDYIASTWVVYEGQEHGTGIGYSAYSPSTYPYILEIVNATFNGTKIYNELGELTGVADKKVTLNFINNHDTINLTIRMLLIEEYDTHRAVAHATLDYKLLSQQTGNITTGFNWQEGKIYRIFMIAVHGEPANPYVSITNNDVVTFSTYYYYNT
jgi:hypothetical protein